MSKFKKQKANTGSNNHGGYGHSKLQLPVIIEDRIVNKENPKESYFVVTLGANVFGLEAGSQAVVHFHYDERTNAQRKEVKDYVVGAKMLTAKIGQRALVALQGVSFSGKTNSSGLPMLTCNWVVNLDVDYKQEDQAERPTVKLGLFREYPIKNKETKEVEGRGVQLVLHENTSGFSNADELKAAITAAVDGQKGNTYGLKFNLRGTLHDEVLESGKPFVVDAEADAESPITPYVLKQNFFIKYEEGKEMSEMIDNTVNYIMNETDWGGYLESAEKGELGNVSFDVIFTKDYKYGSDAFNKHQKTPDDIKRNASSMYYGSSELDTGPGVDKMPLQKFVYGPVAFAYVTATEGSLAGQELVSIKSAFPIDEAAPVFIMEEIPGAGRPSEVEEILMVNAGNRSAERITKLREARAAKDNTASEEPENDDNSNGMGMKP